MSENILSLDNVKVELVKEGNLITVKIDGDCEVKVNNEVIFSPQQKEEHRYLPKHLVPFIQEHEEYISIEGDNIEIDLNVEGETVTMYVPKNRRKKKLICRYDTSEPDSSQRLQNEYDNIEDLVNKYKLSYDKMNKELKEIGYQLEYSHSQEEFIWCWSDIYFDVKDFNEEEFLKVSKIVLEHNKVIKELYNELY